MLPPGAPATLILAGTLAVGYTLGRFAALAHARKLPAPTHSWCVQNSVCLSACMIDVSTSMKLQLWAGVPDMATQQQVAAEPDGGRLAAACGGTRARRSHSTARRATLGSSSTSASTT